MAYNRAKLIVDIYQVFIKIINQQLQGMIGKPKPSNAQLNIANALSTDLGTAIHNYVLNGEFVLSMATAYTIPNGASTYWLNSSGGEVYNLYSSNTLDFESPSGANTIISAVNYTRTISVTSIGSGAIQSRIFLDRTNNGDWFMVSRATTFNTAYATIPANTRAAISMINVSTVPIQVNISILKAGKTS